MAPKEDKLMQVPKKPNGAAATTTFSAVVMAALAVFISN